MQCVAVVLSHRAVGTSSINQLFPMTRFGETHPPTLSGAPKEKWLKKKLNDYLGRVICDMGAAMSALLVVIGDKLGLFKAMAGAGPLTSSAPRSA